MHRHLLCLFCKKLLLAPINLLLQELSKSTAQTSNDTKQGEKEESLTEARTGRILSNGKLDQIADQDDVRHTRVRPGGEGARGWRGIRNVSRLQTWRRRDLQEDVSPPPLPPFIVKHLFPDQFLFCCSSLNRPLFIHRGMTNSLSTVCRANNLNVETQTNR